MQNLCRRCFSPIKTGQLVSVVVTAPFKELKSAIHYALDTSEMIADADTLVHADEGDCKYYDDYQV
jgi:hypothetical protein